MSKALKPASPAAKRRGRPAIQEGTDTVVVNVRMTNPQREKLMRLGGSQWVRTKIDKAADPKDSGE